MRQRNELKRDCLRALAVHGPMNAPAFAKLLGLRPISAYNYLGRMRSFGLVEDFRFQTGGKIPAKTAGREMSLYRITPKGRDKLEYLDTVEERQTA